MQKIFNVLLDTKVEEKNPLFVVNTNDLKTVKINLLINQDKEPLDLTGATVRLAVKKPDDLTVMQDITVIDAAAGTCEILLNTQAYVIDGNYVAEVMIYYGVDTVAVTGQFTYKAVRGILNNGTVTSTNEFQSITQTLNDVQATVEDLRLNGTGIDAQARADIASQATLLAERATKTDILTPVGYTRMIGHRGFSGVAPEGTLPAIIIASELGLWSAEGDAQLTADGEWIVFHDSTVDRMTNGTENVKDLTLAQIKSLNIDSGNNVAYYPNLKIPTLKEYLLTCKQYNVVPCIEIKSDTYEPTYTSEQYDSFVRIIKECGLENKIMVQGSEPLCTQIRNRSKAITLMVFTDFTSLQTWAGSYIQTSGNMLMNTDNSYVTSKADVELAHSMGVAVSVFVVDDISRALELQSWGVEFIMTNVIAGGER